ncbi:MAG: MGMT family protein [Bacteroidia bacterium]|jgi:methylated-DNA-protein-cysteine methyltransferase-like protein|nr:MGMT family protein [Bacteroidia bacterium]MCC6768982.1 MGMT family protein [Bacteroidia bacterium]
MNDKREQADFFERVYQVVRLIPSGRVTSYGAIARYLGIGSAARTVGWALNGSFTHKEYVPAHRVVNRMGMLSGKFHFPSPDAMQTALENEGIKVMDDQIVGFEKYFWDPSKELSL